MKRRLVPTSPVPLILDDKSVEYLAGWISYFRNLSPRIRIKLPTDQGFNLGFIKSELIKIIDHGDEDEVEILDWPEVKEIAFIIKFDSSLPNEKPVFLSNDTYLFCYYDVAFTLRHFQYEDSDKDTHNAIYSLSSFNKDLLSWKFISSLIANSLKKINESVPVPPQD